MPSFNSSRREVCIRTLSYNIIFFPRKWNLLVLSLAFISLLLRSHQCSVDNMSTMWIANNDSLLSAALAPIPHFPVVSCNPVCVMHGNTDTTEIFLVFWILSLKICCYITPTSYSVKMCGWMSWNFPERSSCSWKVGKSLSGTSVNMCFSFAFGLWSM